MCQTWGHKTNSKRGGHWSGILEGEVCPENTPQFSFCFVFWMTMVCGAGDHVGCMLLLLWKQCKGKCSFSLKWQFWIFFNIKHKRREVVNISFPQATSWLKMLQKLYQGVNLALPGSARQGSRLKESSTILLGYKAEWLRVAREHMGGHPLLLSQKDSTCS